MPTSFEKLVHDASQGDSVAVDQLLEEFLPSVHAYVRLRAGKLLVKESSWDLAQSVCRDVLENIEHFQYGGAQGFRKWMFTTARRKLADRREFYRAEKRDIDREVRQPATDEEARDQQGLLEAYRAVFSPSQEAAGKEEMDRLERAVRRLPEDQRDIVLMAKIGGLSRAEIAHEMGRTEGAVRTTLFRALARLADLIES